MFLYFSNSFSNSSFISFGIFIGVGSKETPSNLDVEALAETGEEMDPLLYPFYPFFILFSKKFF